MTQDNADVRDGEDVVDLPERRDAGLIYIGHIETPWAERCDCPRGGDSDIGPDCRIILDPRWVPALQGIQADDRLQILYWMDRARRDLLTQSPGNDGQTRGTFALRSPCRPNPIASSIVRLLAIEENCLVVRGLDCVSGTPLIDIKPETVKGK